MIVARNVYEDGPDTVQDVLCRRPDGTLYVEELPGGKIFEIDEMTAARIFNSRFTVIAGGKV